MVAWYGVSLANLELFPRILLLYSSELGLATRATERDTEAGSKAVAITLVKQWPLRKAGVIHITCGSSAGCIGAQAGTLALRCSFFSFSKSWVEPVYLMGEGYQLLLHQAHQG